MQHFAQVNKDLIMTQAFPPSNPQAAEIRTILLQNKHKIKKALEPELSKRVGQIINQKYNRILEKVEMARSQQEKKGMPLRNIDREEFLKDEDQIHLFCESLSDHLQDMVPEILN